MKKLLVTLVAALVSASTFGQGTVAFHNRPGSGDAPVSRPDLTGAGAGITAQLFLVGAGGALTALTPASTFRTTSPAAAFFISPVDVVVPGIAAGSPATFRVRAWDSTAASFDAAAAGGLLFGESNDVNVSGLGGISPTGTIVPTPDLSGLTGFTLVPEPSSMALGLLGAAALLYRRRK